MTAQAQVTGVAARKRATGPGEKTTPPGAEGAAAAPDGAAAAAAAPTAPAVEEAPAG